MVAQLFLTLWFLRDCPSIARETNHGGVAFRIVLTLVLFPPFWSGICRLRDDWCCLDSGHIRRVVWLVSLLDPTIEILRAIRNCLEYPRVGCSERCWIFLIWATHLYLKLFLVYILLRLVEALLLSRYVRFADSCWMAEPAFPRFMLRQARRIRFFGHIACLSKWEPFFTVERSCAVLRCLTADLCWQ